MIQVRKYANGGVPGIFLWSLMIAVLCLPGLARAQGSAPDSLLTMRFLRPDVMLEKPGSHFNVLEIKNNGRDLISGIVRIDCPDSWRMIGMGIDTLVLEPGSTKMIPVRVSIPGNTIGGVSYVIGAELFGKDLYNYANSYVSIQRKSKWEMRLGTNQIYISDFMPYGEVNVSLTNSGNSNELVKLSLDLGDLLEFRSEIEADSFLYVDLPAYTDTSIKLVIQRRDDLSYSEKKALDNNWKARILDIHASTTNSSNYGSIRATPLESEISNTLPIYNAPLNAELTVYNLLSQQRKKMSARVFGQVLFPGTQELYYSLGYYNLYFDADMNREIDLYQQLRYTVRYMDQNTMVWIGDRLGTGQLHTLTGRGISATHQLNDRNMFSLNVIQNPYGGSIGGFAGYGGYLGNVGVNTGVTLETTTQQLYSHTTWHLGGNYQLNQRHSFHLQTATSLSNFKASSYTEHDTTVLGFAYQFIYRYRGNRLLINFDNTNTLFTYIRNSGINRINFSGHYKITEKLLLKTMYYRSDYTSTKYPYNFLYPPNVNMNENARILFSVHRGRVVYQGGPRYSGTSRRLYVINGDYETGYYNYQPGILGSVSFRLKNGRSISPHASFNSMFYSYDRGNEVDETSNMDWQWTYTIGINYYDQAFKLNAYYTSGDVTDVYRSSVVNNTPLVNQAFHIRPYYERYFFKETLRVSAFLNYSYYMPSMRENILFNLTGNIHVNKTWDFYGSFNIYRVSRRDVDVGRMTSRDVNLFLGVRKAFDIQQPRMGYGDLTIIGFNDLDGDGIKSEEEKPISNVLVQISRDPDKNVESRSGFVEVSMITDPRGEIFYERIPYGVYDLSLIPLSNLENLYFLNGHHQTIEINNDMVHYLPLVESYKIKGRIIIDRDPNSNEGTVSPQGIRVTAVGENGETFSTLSSGLGTFVLDLPRATSYEVSIYNVFGENFRLERGSYKVQFTDNKIINLDFKFEEKRRGIEFREGEQLFQFDLGNGKE
ncbi:MAG: hypothetical protein V2B15_13215 [Bacteroidota bacterium]